MAVDKSAFDKWSPVHFGSGAIAGAGGMSFGTYLFISVAFEMIERRYYERFTRPETNKNVAVDIAVGLAAFTMFKRRS